MRLQYQDVGNNPGTHRIDSRPHLSEDRATDQQPGADAADSTGTVGEDIGSIETGDTPSAARDRGVTRRRAAAVGILAVLLFAVAFAVGTATKGHRSINGVAQPAQATIASHSTPAKITAVLESSAVPGLRQVTVKKPAPSPPNIVAGSTPQPGPTTTFVPAPAPPQAPGPTHTPTTVGGGGSLGGGGGSSTGGGLGGGGSSTGGGG